MLIQSLPASQGDSFILKWDKNKSMIIDGGMPSCERFIIAETNDTEIRYIFVTHVDYDHIGGLLKAVSNPNFKISKAKHFMNHPDHAYSYPDTKFVKYKHGDLYSEILLNRGITNYQASDMTVINDNNLKITILSPKESDIDELNKNWNASKVEKNNKFDYIIRQKNNGDIINRSSITLLIENNNRLFLFLADAHPSDIIKKLKDLGYSEDNPIKIDFLKLSHHGSKHNTNDELLRIIKTDTYYISTNTAKYNHPDKEIFQFIFNSINFHNISEVKVLTNYNIVKKIELLIKDDKMKERIKVSYQKEISFI